MARPPMPLGSHTEIIVRSKETTVGTRWRAECYVRDMDGHRRRVERWADTAPKARRKLQAVLAERTGAAVSEGLTGSARFSEALDMWLADIGRRRADTTYDNYRQRTRNLVRPALGELRLQEITVGILDAFMTRLAERGLSVSTRRNVRTVLSGALAIATRHGVYRSNPARDMTRIEGKEAKRAVRALTKAERTDLLTKIDEQAMSSEMLARRDLPALFRFLMGTGARIGEALAVRWADVDLEAATVAINGNVVSVRGKGLVRHDGKTVNARRVVALAPFLVSMLHARITSETDPNEPIFPNSMLSYRDPSRVGKWIRHARVDAGYPWLTSHVFRKTAATILDEMGFSAREIADMLGHSRPSITQDMYMHRGVANPRTAEALDQALRSK